MLASLPLVQFGHFVHVLNSGRAEWFAAAARGNASPLASDRRVRSPSKLSPSMRREARQFQTAPRRREPRLVSGAMEIGQRRRSPDIGLAALPHLRPLRRVLMPRPRLEIAELFIEHLVELAEQLDDLIVRIAVIGCDIVPRTVAQRPPDDRDLALAKQVARVLQMNEILQLERHVMHFDVVAANEIHGVVISVATHEHEEVFDPIGDAETHHFLIELGRLLRIIDHPGDVAELERTDADMQEVLAQIAPLLEQRDGGALVVLEGQRRANARNRIIAQLALNAVLLELARHGAEIGIGGDFKRQCGAALDLSLGKGNRQLADLRDQEGAVLLAFRQNEPHDLRVVVDHLLQIWRLESSVADASGLNHDALQPVAAVPSGSGGRINHRADSNSSPLRRRGAVLPSLRDRGLVRRTITGELSMAGVKAAGYKLATYRSADGPRAGLVIGDAVFDVAKLTGVAEYATVLGILQDWKAAERVLRRAAVSAGKSRAKRQPLAKTKLLAPVRFPSAIYCAGANYADHAAAMAAREGNPPPADPHEQGLKPWHFLKAARTLADPGATIKISGYAENMDWEIELAAVIGRPTKDVTAQKALDYVAGYAVANDLSARDRGRRPPVPPTSPFKMDWKI